MLVMILIFLLEYSADLKKNVQRINLVLVIWAKNNKTELLKLSLFMR